MGDFYILTAGPVDVTRWITVHFVCKQKGISFFSLYFSERGPTLSGPRPFQCHLTAEKKRANKENLGSVRKEKVKGERKWKGEKVVVVVLLQQRRVDSFLWLPWRRASSVAHPPKPRKYITHAQLAKLYIYTACYSRPLLICPTVKLSMSDPFIFFRQRTF